MWPERMEVCRTALSQRCDSEIRARDTKFGPKYQSAEPHSDTERNRFESVSLSDVTELFVDHVHFQPDPKTLFANFNETGNNYEAQCCAYFADLYVPTEAWAP